MKDSYLNLLKESVSKKSNILEQESKDIRNEIKKFFKENPYPKDKQVHNLAGSLGIEPDELESHIYSLLTDYLKIGKHQDIPDSEFNSKELSMGIDIEKEHSDYLEIRKEIAKDHLSEINNYYSLLKKMEEDANKEKI